MDGDRKPWEQQPGETAKAYQAFCVYRDLGAGRSLSIAYESTGKGRSKTGERSGKTEAPRLWERWSSKYKWVERSQAYDAHIARIRLDAIASAEGETAKEGYLDQLEEFRTAHLRAGKGGMLSVLRLKQRLDAFLASPEFQIQTIDDAYRVALMIKAIESGSGDMWAAALGVKSLVESTREG